MLTAAAMRAADGYAIDPYGLPGFTLMETAGRAAADAMEAHFGPVAGRRVACCCGKGNNGGDGLVVARVLHARGAVVDVVLSSDADELSPDAAHNLRLLQTLAANDPDGRLHVHRLAAPLDALPPADLAVDALLGTGLTRAPRAPLDGMIAWLNARTAPVTALDLPSGLNSDDGCTPGAVVEAALTVTMGALKAGLLLGEGPRVAGRVVTAEIGIPAFALSGRADAAGCARRSTDDAVRRWLPARGHDANKYSVGLAVVVAGSPGMTGAPVMAATAAARAGAGYVVCACHEALHDVLAAKLTEVTTLPLPDADGGIDPDGALAALAPRLEKARALLVGCGLGRHPATQRFVRALLAQTDLPVVLDADGLNALVGHTDLLAEHARGRWILTPHAGEFERLAGEKIGPDGPIETARRFARRWNSVLVLKGLPSVTATPDGQVCVNATGNPALATAGTGDVLAGLCAGLLAQGLPPGPAAVAALHVGGAAADRYTRRRAGRAMVATDLLRQLPLVLRERFT